MTEAGGYSVIRTSPEKDPTVTLPDPEPVVKSRDRFGVKRPRVWTSSSIPGKLALTLPENDVTRNRASVFEPRASSTVPEWLSMSILPAGARLPRKSTRPETEFTSSDWTGISDEILIEPLTAFASIVSPSPAILTEPLTDSSRTSRDVPM